MVIVLMDMVSVLVVMIRPMAGVNLKSLWIMIALGFNFW